MYSNNSVAKSQELASVATGEDKLKFLSERFLQRHTYSRNSLISKVALLDRCINQSINHIVVILFSQDFSGNSYVQMRGGAAATTCNSLA